MKKVLLYHMFCGKNYFDGNNIAVEVNKICLKHYANVFDEMTFVLTTDDMTDTDTMKKAMAWVEDVSNGIPTNIKIRKNTYLYETKTFKDEILDKSAEIKDMVFFAHNKGCTRTNVDSSDDFTPSNVDSLCRWICALYYYSLEFMDEVEGALIGKIRPSEIFYGPLLTIYKDPSISPMHRMNKNNLFYQGTFFWMNMPKFNNYRERNIFTLPEVDDRFYTEMLPGTICSRAWYGSGIYSHNDKDIDNSVNLYTATEEEWDGLCERLTDKEGFFNFYNDVMLKLNT